MMPSDPTVGIEDDEWNVHFSESGAGRHRPRAIFIGSEPSSIDAIRTGSWRQLYIPEQLISGQYACYDSLSETDNGLYCGVPDDEITSAEGEAYFAEVNDLALDRIRKLADNTTGLAGFRVISSAEEGFGSGAGKFLLESLAAEYPTKSIHTYTVLPPRSSLDGSAIVTYNALFALAPTEQIASRAYVFGADTIETDVQAAVVASLLADSPTTSPTTWATASPSSGRSRRERRFRTTPATWSRPSAITTSTPTRSAASPTCSCRA
jgi:hypothetical protein